MRGNSLLQTAFSTRTLSLFERLPATALPSYLSGLVIGEELRAQSLQASRRVVLIGSAFLTRRYQSALALLGILRGVQPHEAVDIGEALTSTGWTMIEVPLNSPDPLQSIAAVVREAVRAVMHPGTLLLPVGDITTDNMSVYRAAGANGFGIDSALYKPGMPASEVKESAMLLIASYEGTIRGLSAKTSPTTRLTSVSG